MLLTWYPVMQPGPFNTLRPRQNGHHFPDGIFKCIFLNENELFSIKISLKSVPKGPINSIPVLVQIMVWRRPGDKPLSEPMLVCLMAHICVTQSQWFNAFKDRAPIKKNLRMPDLRMSCNDFTQRYGTRIVVPVMGARVKCPQYYMPKPANKDYSCMEFDDVYCITLWYSPHDLNRSYAHALKTSVKWTPSSTPSQRHFR